MKTNLISGVIAYLFLFACAYKPTAGDISSNDYKSSQPEVQKTFLEQEVSQLHYAQFCTIEEYSRLPANAPQCSDLFQDSKKEITDLNSFGLALTEGVLLNPNQIDLFDVYRKLFFGDPKTDTDKNLKHVLDELRLHPELIKLHFPEYEVSFTEKSYETPEALVKYLKSQIQTAGDIRNNLFKIDSNLGFWKKVLDYTDDDVPAELQSMQKKLGQNSSREDKEAYRQLKATFEARNKKKFETYLNRIINKANRDLLATLKNDNQEYDLKGKSLFKTLKYLQEWMDKKGRNTQVIRQAMVDLVATIGYGNQATQTLLKSKNGLEKVEGLTKIRDEADAFAMQLGYAGHFVELMQNLRIDFATGSSKNEDVSKIISSFEKEVLAGKSHIEKADLVRVRSLSIQEAPFRSCLGGSDCSSRTYFSKALDPNYNYFTMTDKDNQSSGHVTVVLGEAKNLDTQKFEKVAFVDKIQNVANNKMQMFLTAVSKSLAEQGYILVIPQDVGDHNGLSNVDTTRHFVDQEILPKLTKNLQSFKPTKHQYNFPNKYSRAYDNLNVKVFDPTAFNQGLQAQHIEIKPGRKYKPQFADVRLDKTQLIKEFLSLKSSAKEEDLLKYIASGAFIGQLEQLGLYKTDEFKNDLLKIIGRKDVSFQARKLAVFEILIMDKDGPMSGIEFLKFNEQEQTQMTSEIRQWGKTNDLRRKNFYNSLESKWEKAFQNADMATLIKVISLNLFNINTKNESGFLPIVIAAHANQKKVVEWILDQPNIDLSLKDEFGMNVIEQIRLMGKNDIADLIQSRHPELKSKKIEVKERTIIKSAEYPMGMPIMDFVEIAPGKFRMGDKKVPTKITNPFQLMSTHTTQKQWKEIVELADRSLSGKLNLRTSPSHFKGEFNPVENVSYDEVVLWTKALNELSKLDDPNAQNKLNDLFVGHHKGDLYRLPTEAEYEYVLRQRGLANGRYLHGDSENGLLDYAFCNENSGKQTHPVGKEKPIFINGKPIYGLQGNVSHWISDWYNEQLTGGVNPQGPTIGTHRVNRGSGLYNIIFNLSSTRRDYNFPDNRVLDLGFRLVRTRP